MTEFRRLKMKVGEAAFEADVPADKVQSMYAQFLDMLERRSQSANRLVNPGAEPDQQEFDPVPTHHAGISELPPEQTVLSRIFDLRDDEIVTLKLLPNGPDGTADAMLLLLYGYRRLKKQDHVLATELFRAAELSGVFLRRPAKEPVRNSRFVIRGGQRKGSHYSLNGAGVAMAKEIAAKLAG